MAIVYNVEAPVDGFVICTVTGGCSYIEIEKEGYPYAEQFNILKAHRFLSAQDAFDYWRIFKKEYPSASIEKLNVCTVSVQRIDDLWTMEKKLASYEEELAALKAKYGVSK